MLQGDVVTMPKGRPHPPCSTFQQASLPTTQDRMTSVEGCRLLATAEKTYQHSFIDKD